MPTPIKCPFTRTELSDMVVKKLTLAQIAQAGAVKTNREKPLHKNTVSKWLALAGLSPANVPHHRQCEVVFTEEALRDMYIRKFMSTYDIARRAAEIMEWSKPPTSQTVVLWLLRAGIKIRANSDLPSQSRKLLGQKISVAYRKRLADGWTPHPGKPCPHLQKPGVHERSVASRNANTTYSVYELTCRICEKPFVRKAWRVHDHWKKGGKFILCSSRTCAGKSAAYQKNLPSDFRELLPGDYDAEGKPKEFRLIRMKKSEYERRLLQQRRSPN